MNYIIDQTKLFAAIDNAIIKKIPIEDLISQIKTEKTSVLSPEVKFKEIDFPRLLDVFANNYVNLLSLLDNEKASDHLGKMKEEFSVPSKEFAVIYCINFFFHSIQVAMDKLAYGIYH